MWTEKWRKKNGVARTTGTTRTSGTDPIWSAATCRAPRSSTSRAVKSGDKSPAGKGQALCLPSPLSQGGQFPLFTGVNVSLTGRSQSEYPKAGNTGFYSFLARHSSLQLSSPLLAMCLFFNRRWSVFHLRLYFIWRILSRIHLSNPVNRSNVVLKIV